MDPLAFKCPQVILESLAIILHHYHVIISCTDVVRSTDEDWLVAPLVGRCYYELLPVSEGVSRASW